MSNTPYCVLKDLVHEPPLLRRGLKELAAVDSSKLLSLYKSNRLRRQPLPTQTYKENMYLHRTPAVHVRSSLTYYPPRPSEQSPCPSLAGFVGKNLPSRQRIVCRPQSRRARSPRQRSCIVPALHCRRLVNYRSRNKTLGRFTCILPDPQYPAHLVMQSHRLLVLVSGMSL